MTRVSAITLVFVLCVVSGVVAAGAAEDTQSSPDITLYMIGQSHIDVAWRWQWSETITVAHDTFAQAIKLMHDYPDFGYTQSQAVLYAAMQENYPDLFADIKRAVADGRWDVVGGMWVEPDLNMPSGESLVRQCLYGQRYFRKELGVEARFCWVPDTFGMPWTVPQIIKKSHMDSIAFGKFEVGPAAFLMWEGPDGSQVWLSDPRGLFSIIGRAAMRPDAASQLPEALWVAAEKTGGNAIAIPYGVGDHGGGPTRADIERFHALAKQPGMPQIKLATGDEALAAMKKAMPHPPVWRDECNYWHRGCYTSQAEMKRLNRQCEALLPNAEKFAVMAQVTGGFDYPRQALAEAWRGALFNQFHDILPGSSITAVHADAMALYRDVTAKAGGALEDALMAISQRAATRGDGDAVIVFNPLPWPRSDIVQVALDYDEVPQHLAVHDATGAAWAAQVVGNKRIYERFQRCQVIFVARDVPPLGFNVFWVKPAQQGAPSGLSTGDNWLESKRYRVEVDPQTGHVVSIRDKELGRELLAPGAHANVLRLLGDRGDAWELRPTGEVTELASPGAASVVERGPVRATIRVQYAHNGSIYQQRISIYDDLDRIDFPTIVDWRELHHTLRVHFPLAVKADSFTREIPFGNIAHSCNGDEVPAQKWIDLSDGTWGVSLLNDCKYGHSVNGSEMAITLLRSSTDPDPVADLGRRTMTYTLRPHAGSWQDALIQRSGEEINTPLLARVTPGHDGPLGSSYSMLTVSPANVFLAAAKPCEDSNDLLVRIWEAHGQGTRAEVKLPRAARSVTEVDLLEDKLGPVKASGDRLAVDLKPYEIRSFKIGW